MPDLVQLPQSGSEDADVNLDQTVDGKDREELLSLQQRLESRIQVCLSRLLSFLDPD